MRTLLVCACLLFAAVWTASGCNSDQRVDIPSDPVPMPTGGPESASTSMPEPER